MRTSILSLVCLVFLGCGSMVTVGGTDDVEVAPGKWLPVREETTVPTSELRRGPLVDVWGPSESDSGDKMSLAFDWKGRKVTWRGGVIPIALREYDGSLYMAAFDRTDLFKARFVYFELNDAGTDFKEIKPEQFPKPIATQNMWLLPDARYVSVEGYGTHVDTWEPLRKLDIKHPIFRSGLTAQMWCHLEKGLQYYETDATLIDEALLEEYVRKYQPIALPTIVKEQ